MPKTSSKRKEKKKIVKKRKQKPPLKAIKKTTKKRVKKEKERFVEAIGRRKTATTRVRIFPKSKEKEFFINKKKANVYFPDFELQEIIFAPLRKTGLQDKFKIEALVKGGGKRGQAEAILLGLSRAIIKIDQKYRDILRAAGYLTRDPRMKERKKFGLKKARRAPQWQKR